MKLLIYSDVHWCQYSSIIKQRGEGYSIRLEHLINSVNWAENLAKEHNCDEILILGDFFDKPYINDEEMTALSEIHWSKLPHTFVLGNHEIKNKNKEYSSLHIMKLLGFNLITEPKSVRVNDVELCYLPYCLDFPTLESIFGKKDSKRVVFSHNDIEGVKLGGYVFEKGFSLDNIAKSCDLFLNGHIHTYGEYGNVVNLGSLCGLNLSENNIPHRAYTLDTDTFELTPYENPYAFNFYKIDCTKNIKDFRLKKNSIVLVKCTEDNLEEVKSVFNSKENILEIKYVLVPKEIEEEVITEDIIQIDHLKSLQEYIFKQLGTNEVVKEELSILTS